MNNLMTTDKMMTVLNSLYDHALDGIPGAGTVEELAMDYLQGEGSLVDQANRLIRFQNAKCATSGFISGLGGLITLPVTIPANISSVMYVQARMVAAIAYMGGHDIRCDQVRTFVYLCFCGNEAKDVLKKHGIQIAKKMAESGIKKIPNELIKAVNRFVGFRLLTKYGEKGVINLCKWVPVAGGIVGAASDGIANNTVGNVARNMFIGNA